MSTQSQSKPAWASISVLWVDAMDSQPPMVHRPSRQAWSAVFSRIVSPPFSVFFRSHPEAHVADGDGVAEGVVAGQIGSGLGHAQGVDGAASVQRSSSAAKSRSSKRSVRCVSTTQPPGRRMRRNSASTASLSGK